jgi:ABC-type multidrug transport system fused ATPase/permease subunit
LLDTFRKLRALLSPREQRQAVIVFAMMVLAAFVEVIGVASVMPFITVLADPGVVQTTPLLANLQAMLGLTETRDFLIVLGTAMLVVFLTSLGFRALTLYAIQRFATMRIHSIALRLMKNYLSQPYEVVLNRNSASLAKTVLAEVGSVANGVLLPAMRALSGAVVAIAIIILLVVVEPIISVVLALGLGLMYLIIYVLTKPLFSRAGKARLKANDERFVLAGEALQGLKELRVLGREQNYLARFAAPSREFARRHAQTLIVRELPYFLVQGVAFGGVMLLLIVLIARGDTLATILPLVTVYAFAGYRMLPAFQDIYRSLGQVRFDLPALDELYADFQRRVDTVPSLLPQTQPLRLNKAIRFEDVTVQYGSSSRPAVHGLGLEIEAGTSVGFIGHTGAGKSTAIDILLGLLNPTGGQVLIDGAPLGEDNVRAWQSNIGYVPQSIFLADDTVAANIAFGVPHDKIDMAAVERAGRQARIHDFVVGELPLGYQTTIGEKGARLSGGQRQRLGIARALYHDPQIIVFDEATSALDNKTESLIIETFNSLHGQKTIVMVAHRLSTLESCDKLFMLDNGSLVAQGSYAEVAATDQFQVLANVNRVEVE